VHERLGSIGGDCGRALDGHISPKDARGEEGDADIYSAEEDGDDAAVALVRVSFSGIDLVMLQV
jgi:hypothetical protein